MLALNVDPTHVTENALIVLFARRRDPEGAEIILKELSAPAPERISKTTGKALIPTVFLYGPLMAAYAAVGDIAGAEGVFSRILQSGIQPTSAIFNVLIAQRARQHDLS
ncbi:hypothetical protein BJ684DRAFT_20844, partial [Piptocephalis cylindrospora]